MDKDNDDDFSLSSYYENNVASSWGGYHTENQFDVLRDDYEAPSSNSRYEPTKHDNVRNGRANPAARDPYSFDLGESYNPNNVKNWDGKSRDCHGNPISPLYDPKRSFAEQWSEHCQNNPPKCAKEIVQIGNAIMGNNDIYEGVGYGMSKGFEYLTSFFWTREKMAEQKAEREAKEERDMKAKEAAEKKEAEDKKAIEDVNTVMSLVYKGVSLIFSSPDKLDTKHNYSPLVSRSSTPVSSPVRPLKGGYIPMTQVVNSPTRPLKGGWSPINSPTDTREEFQAWAREVDSGDIKVVGSSNPPSPTRDNSSETQVCRLM